MKKQIILAVFFILLFFTLPSHALITDRALSQFIVDHWTSTTGLPQNTAESIIQTRDGFLWIATEEGFVKFDGITYTVYDSAVLPIETNQVQILVEDPKKPVIWVGFSRGGLLSFNYKTGENTLYTKKQGLPDCNIKDIVLDKDNSFWLATEDIGLVHYTLNEEATIFNKQSGLPTNNVKKITLDRQNRLWIAGDSKEITYILNNRVTSLATLSHQVTLYYIDQNDRLFVGTLGGGLYQVDPTTNSVTPFHDEMLGDEKVGAITQDSLGTFYIGTYENGLYRIRNKGKANVTANDTIAINYAVAFFNDKEGSLWVGTRGYGLYRLKAGKFISYGKKNGLKQAVAFPVMELADGAILTGIWAGGLYRMKKRKFKQIRYPPALTSKTTVLSFAQDSDESLWVSTYGNGVLHIEKDTTRLYTTKDGLADNIVSTIFIDSLGALWFGSFKGILHKLVDGRMQQFGLQEGLNNSSIRSITEDNGGNLIISTKRGVFIKKEDRFRPLHPELESINADGIHITPNGRIYFASSKGLLILENNKLHTIGRHEGLPVSSSFDVITDNNKNVWLTSNKGIVFIEKTKIDAFINKKEVSVKATLYGVGDGLPTPECDGGTQPNIWKGKDGRIWFPTAKGVVVVNPEQIVKNTLPPPTVITSIKTDNNLPFQCQQIEQSFPPETTSIQINYTGLSLLFPEKVSFIYRLKGLSKTWIDAGSRRHAIYTSLPHGTYTFEVKAANNDGVWSTKAAEFTFRIEPFFYQRIWFRLLTLLLLITGGTLFIRHKISEIKRKETLLAEMVEEKTKDLKEIIRHIKKMSGKLQKISNVLSISMHDTQETFNLSQTMMEDASTSLSGITTKLTGTKTNVLNMNKVVTSLGKKADTSSAVLEGVVTSMTNVQTAVNKIEDIVEVVDEIAFKTNLLSLNAAIEAARAGDSVKGFTVVADAIRELSKQTSDALNIIKQHISETVQTVESGQDAVNASVTFITQLIGDFRAISSMMENISSLISNHLQEVESIDHSVTAVSGHSLKASLLVKDILNVSKQLDDETTRLKREVGKISDS